MKTMIADQENYFGIPSMKSNPVNHKIRQELSSMLFLHPEISPEDARIIGHTYITDDRATALYNRLFMEILEIRKEDIHKQIILSIEDWVTINHFPSMADLREIEYFAGNSAENIMHIFYKFLVDDLCFISEVYLKYVQAYGPFLSKKMMDEVLDFYLLSKEVEETY